jgi:hypothetical protein
MIREERRWQQPMNDGRRHSVLGLLSVLMPVAVAVSWALAEDVFTVPKVFTVAAGFSLTAVVEAVVRRKQWVLPVVALGFSLLLVVAYVAWMVYQVETSGPKR